MAGVITPWNSIMRFNPQDSGDYQITGVVTRLGVVIADRRVDLIERFSGRPLKSTWTDSAGNYSFLTISYKERGYCIIAYDVGAAPYNAAIADYVTPVKIP